MARYVPMIIMTCALILTGALFGYYYNSCLVLGTRITELNDRLASLEKENEGYRKQLEDMMKRKLPFDDSEEIINALTMERDELLHQTGVLRDRISTLEQELKDRDLTIKTREEEIEKLKNEMLKLARNGAPPRPEPDERSPSPEMEAYIDDLLKRYDFTSLERLGEVAVPAFLDLLNEGIPSYRQRAAFTLGEIRDGSAVGPLSELLDDPEDFVAVEAARSLGKIGDPRAEDALIKMLGKNSDRYWEVQRESIISLRALNSVKAVPALIKIAGSGRVDLQDEANASLRRITFHYISDPNLDALPSNWSAWWKKNRGSFENVRLKGQEQWTNGNPLK